MFCCKSTTRQPPTALEIAQARNSLLKYNRLLIELNSCLFDDREKQINEVLERMEKSGELKRARSLMSALEEIEKARHTSRLLKTTPIAENQEKKTSQCNTQRSTSPTFFSPIQYNFDENIFGKYYVSQNNSNNSSLAAVPRDFPSREEIEGWDGEVNEITSSVHPTI